MDQEEILDHLHSVMWWLSDNNHTQHGYEMQCVYNQVRYFDPLAGMTFRRYCVELADIKFGDTRYRRIHYILNSPVVARASALVRWLLLSAKE